MEKFSFFNDVNDDRVYYAEDWARHLKKYFTNGIFNNELNVVSNNDMTITIKEGDANIEGYRYTNTGDLVKTIDNADGTLNRIDNVVLRLDLTNRLISAQIIKGTFADKPVEPELVRTSTIYDLRIAKISIPAGTTTITQDLITDTRFITSDCGNVISTVQTPDTENLFIQMQTLFEKQINELNNNFEIWFDSIKNQLDSDAAGNLQNQINNLNSNKVDNAKFDLDSNNLQLLANGKNVGDSVHIPTGITDTATGEEDLKIVNNRGVVKFSLEGKTEQKTYTGKNLFYDTPSSTTSNGITLTKNSDGSFTLNGTSTDVSAFNFTLPKVLLAGTYTFSIKGSGNIPGCVFLRARDNSMTMVETKSQVNGNDTTQNSHTFTCKKDISIVAINITQAGITFDNFVIYPQLEIGSEATEFEPYVGGQVSPNPDYPQKIKNVRGVENIWFGGESTTNNGITFTKNSDGSYDITGTATAEANCFNYINIANTKLKNGINYNLSINKLTNGKVIILTEAYANETWDSHVINALNTSNSFLTNKIINIKDNITRVRYGIRVEKGQTVNIKGLKIQLEEGSTIHDYVPYGSNYLQLKNVKKNLFDKNNLHFILGAVDVESIKINNVGKSFYIKCKPNTTYTISRKIVGSRFVVCTTNGIPKQGEKVYGRVTNNVGSSITLTTSSNSNYLCVYYLYNSSENEQEILDSIMIEKGSESTSYEPYKEKIINVDLKGNNLCSNKDKSVKDELLVENGKAKIYKKINEFVLDGSENWIKSSNLNSSRFIASLEITNIMKTKTFNALCNYFTYNIEFGIAKFHLYNTNTDGTARFITFGVDPSTISDLTQWKALLKSLYDSGNPVKVQYQLAEPEVIDLGEVDFELLEGNSTLNLEEDLKSNMSIKYYTDSTVVDLRKKLENKQNVILHGTTAPSNDLGEDGDIYLQHN